MGQPHTGFPRRAALAGLLAVAANTSPPIAAHAATGDEELLQIVANGLAIDAAFRHLSTTWAGEIEMPAHIEQQESALADELAATWEQSGHHNARTLAGLQAKARLALTAMPLNRNGTISQGSTDFLVWSLCRDLLGVRA